MGKKIFFEKLKTHQKATPLSNPEAPLRVMLPPPWRNALWVLGAEVGQEDAAWWLTLSLGQDFSGPCFIAGKYRFLWWVWWLKLYPGT